MRKIEEAKKVNSCVNEILELLEKNNLSEEEIIGVLKTTEECLGLHRPPMGPHPPMDPHMHGPMGEFPEGPHRPEFKPEFKPMDCPDPNHKMTKI